MRERVQLVRVSHPHLGHYEADLVVLDNHLDAERVAGCQVFLPMSKDGIPLEVGERVVIRWMGESTMRGRGVVAEIGQEDEEDRDDQWLTYKLEITLQDHVSNLRHYPRMLGGIRLYFAPVEAIEDADAWLASEGGDEELSQDERFHTSIDELMNFSVSGLSFEASIELDPSIPLICAIGVGGGDRLIRCLGKVVRCVEIGSSSRYEVALHLISPPHELVEELSAFTLRLQKIETEGESDEV